MNTDDKLYIKDFESFRGHTKTLDKGLYTLLRAYYESQERGHNLINFNEVIWDDDVKPIVENLKSAGVKEFTISSGQCGIIETIGLFINEGCELKDSVEIEWYVDDKPRTAIRLEIL